MPSSSFCYVPRRALCATTTIALLAGCAAGAPTPPPPALTTTIIEPSPTPPTAVVRDGRYTLVELSPEDGKRDLMRQVIDVSIPAATHATVGDALRYVLARSGYRLCDEHPDRAAVLYALPLPAAHEHLGPVTLRDALTLLAGPRWILQVDEETRRVCFVPLTSEVAPASSLSALPSPVDPAPMMDGEPSSLLLEDQP